MFTEDEASDKWCPFVRKADSTTQCIASKCMAWRWAQKPNPDWSPNHNTGMWPPADTRYEPPMYIDDKTHGYCGLAGRT